MITGDALLEDAGDSAGRIVIARDDPKKESILGCEWRTLLLLFGPLVDDDERFEDIILMSSIPHHRARRRRSCFRVASMPVERRSLPHSVTIRSLRSPRHDPLFSQSSHSTGYGYNQSTVT